MKKLIALVPALALVAAMMVGCGGDDATTDDNGGSAKNNSSGVNTTPVSLPAKICGACGQEAAEGCCDSGEKCEKCEFVAGSFLCCKDVAKVDGALCTGCGHEAGGDSCCVDGAETCDCGFVKGSPLCCKIEKSAE